MVEDRRRVGRPAARTPHEVALVAQQLFLTRGFDQVSPDDIAAGARISRRTFYRYFATKADVLFVDAPGELVRLRAALATAGGEESYRAVVIRAVVEAMRVPSEDEPATRQRAQLIFSVPDVQAHASRAYAALRGVLAGYAQGVPHGDPLFAVAVGHAGQAAVVAAYEYWIAVPDRDLAELLTRLLELLLPPEPSRT